MSNDRSDATLAPRDAADVAAILAEQSGALEIVGGGSKRAIGKPIEGAVLDVSRLVGVVAYEPAELVLTVRAATPLRVVAELLAANGQRLAFEPPDLSALLGAGGEPTVGGVLAANLAGSRRVSAGAARDHFLGFAAVTGRGERFKAGGKVVKNVTGYDLPKLLAGSWGTLAVLTETTLRVAPAPELDRTLVVPAADAAAGVALLSRALGSAHDVCAAGFDPAEGCLLRLDGFAASVEARTAAMRAELACETVAVLDGAASRQRWEQHAGARALADASVVWRLSVAPSEAPAVLARLGARRYLLDWGGGLILAAFDAVDAAHVRSAFTHGHATLLKAPRAVRAVTSCFQPLPTVAATAAARLKQAFDPRGILNPHRMD